MGTVKPAEWLRIPAKTTRASRAYWFQGTELAHSAGQAGGAGMTAHEAAGLVHT
jgi:hypothetical protein